MISVLYLRLSTSFKITTTLIQTIRSLSSDGPFLWWTLSGIQTQTGEGDPGPEGAAFPFEQSSRRTLQLFKLTFTWYLTLLLLKYLNLSLTYLISDIATVFCSWFWNMSMSPCTASWSSHSVFSSLFIHMAFINRNVSSKLRSYNHHTQAHHALAPAHLTFTALEWYGWWCDIFVFIVT